MQPTKDSTAAVLPSKTWLLEVGTLVMSGLGGANGAYGFKWAGLDKGFILGFVVDWAGSIKGCVDLFIYFKLGLRVWV